MKIVRITFIVLCAVFITTNVFSAEKKQSGPEAYIAKPDYTFQPVIDGQKVKHDFIIQNKGGALLEIKKVKTT